MSEISKNLQELKKNISALTEFSVFYGGLKSNIHFFHKLVRNHAFFFLILFSLSLALFHFLSFFIAAKTHWLKIRSKSAYLRMKLHEKLKFWCLTM